jgi:hypothetical protein
MQVAEKRAASVATQGVKVANIQSCLRGTEAASIESELSPGHASGSTHTCPGRPGKRYALNIVLKFRTTGRQEQIDWRIGQLRDLLLSPRRCLRAAR